MRLTLFPTNNILGPITDKQQARKRIDIPKRSSLFWHYVGNKEKIKFCEIDTVPYK
jgi:hypothetical protein